MQPSRTPSQPKLKILAVDDDRGLLEIIGSDIEKLGFIALLANSKAEALEMARLHGSELALIISDLIMPAGSGLELRQELPRQLQDIPFVLLSGFITQELALRGIELKIAAFLSKPYSIDEFQKAVIRESSGRIENIRERAMLEQTFFGEAASILEELEPLILALERAPNDINTINAIFRYVHTLKGSAGILEVETFTKFAHALEDHLSRIKSGLVPVTTEVIALLLRGYDSIKTMLAALERHDGTQFDLAQLLEHLNGDATTTNPSPPPAGDGHGPNSAPHAASPAKQEAIKVSTQTLDELMALSGEITVLRNMVNKLVRSVEKTNPGNKEVGLLAQLFEEMNKTNSAMQQKIGDMRQMPMLQVLKPMSRLVRDLAKGLGKGLQLSIKGEDLKIDHSVSQVLTDSLVHLVRNSADHGIEDKDTRRLAGKPEAGSVLIDCRQEREDIVVDVSDDGRGIDTRRIRQKLAENGSMTADDAARLSESEVLRQIFAPGFSTALKVTEVSGRGVGMDMVATSVNKLGGRIDLTTKLGEGTTFSLRLPIPKSVLIINSLLVSSRGQTFALHQEHLIRLLRLDVEQQKQISLVEGGAVLMVDGETYPVIQLEQVLWPESAGKHRSLQPADFLNILLLRCNGMSYALLVDDILDGEEIVVKPVGAHLETLQAFAGATFLGDGTVALILNAEGLGRLAGQKALARDLAGSAGAPEAKAPLGETYIAFTIAQRGFYATTLADIFRVEKVPFAALQRSGNLLNLPYRDKIMVVHDTAKLLRTTGSTKSIGSGKDTVAAPAQVADTATASGADGDGMITLVVVSASDRYFGFIVESVSDVTNATDTVANPALHETLHSGVQSTAPHIFINSEPATLIDFKNILRRRGDLLPEPALSSVRPKPTLQPAKADLAVAPDPSVETAATAAVGAAADSPSAGWGLFDEPVASPEPAAAGWGLFD